MPFSVVYRRCKLISKSRANIAAYGVLPPFICPAETLDPQPIMNDLKGCGCYLIAARLVQSTDSQLSILIYC